MTTIMKNSLLFTLFAFLLCAPLQAYSTEIISEEPADDDAISSPANTMATDTTEKKAKRKVTEAFEEKTPLPFKIIGHSIEPGKTETLKWYPIQSSLGKLIDIPVIVVNGTKPGPILGLTAAIHGDELNGIEMIRQVMHELDPKKLKGTIVGIPIVNYEGFWRKDRYIGDRRDLNRYFPGNPEGSYPARVAYSLFTKIIEKCDIVVDLHTGSFFRENLPQLRVDLNVDQVADLATKFGAITALQSTAPPGSLRGAATAAGIPTVVMEIGGPLSLEMDKVKIGVKSLRTFIESVGMIETSISWFTPQPVFYGSEWLRAAVGGILINQVKLGENVKKGALLAEISNPLTNKTFKVYSPIDGTILGRAQNQFVSPGFALFHMVHKRSVEELEKEAVEQKEKSIQTEENQPM